MEQASAAGMKIKVNMVPLRGQNFDQVVPLLEYCLARGYELRFIELMRMGHLARDSNAFLQQFVSLEHLLQLIGERYEYLQANAPVDATALRYQIPGQGYFGVIANESVPFCRTGAAGVAGQGPWRQAAGGIFRWRNGDENHRWLRLAQKLHLSAVRRFSVTGHWRIDA
ncbi:Cyclic pyranopterin monophosphate synthase [compost metagenome]